MSDKPPDSDGNYIAKRPAGAHDNTATIPGIKETRPDRTSTQHRSGERMEMKHSSGNKNPKASSSSRPRSGRRASHDATQSQPQPQPQLQPHEAAPTPNWNTSHPPFNLPGEMDSRRLEQLRNQLSQSFFPGATNLSPAASLLAQLASHQTNPFQNSQAATAAALALVSGLQPGRSQQQQQPQPQPQPPQDNLLLQAVAALSRTQQPFLGYGMCGLTSESNQTNSSTSSSMTSHQHLLELQRQKELDILRQGQEQQQRQMMQEMMRRQIAVPPDVPDPSNGRQREAVLQSRRVTPSKPSPRNKSDEKPPPAQSNTTQSLLKPDQDENAHVAEQAMGNGRLKNAPGSIIMPCRARGMPMDHNFKSAYFVIPENVQHGEDLICSYNSCRKAGIKFCFCAYCKVPVAKRNFRKRHKHGNEDDSSPNEIADEANEADNGAEDRTSTIIKVENRNQGVFEEDRTSSLSSSSNQNRSDDYDENYNADKSTDSENKNSSGSSFGNDEPRDPKRSHEANDDNNDRNHRSVFFEEERMSSFASSSNPTCHPQSSQSSSNPLSSLSSSSNRRPEESTDSDIKTSSGSDEPRGESRGTKRNWEPSQDFQDTTSEESICEAQSPREKSRKQWRSLLYERPTSSDHEALSAWLLKVLSVSGRSQPVKSNITSSLVKQLENGEEASSSFTEHTTSSAESDIKSHNLPSFASLKKYKRRKSGPQFETPKPAGEPTDTAESTSRKSETESTSRKSENAVTESSNSYQNYKRRNSGMLESLDSTNETIAKKQKVEDCASRKSVAVTESADSSSSLSRDVKCEQNAEALKS